MKNVFGLAFLLISFLGYAQADRKLQPLIVVDDTRSSPIFGQNNGKEGIGRVKVLNADSAMLYFGNAGKNGAVIVPSKSLAGPMGKTQPLFILEGMDSRDYLNEIDPNGIESIEVVKDSMATKFYGPSGKNGVIIISLKKGSGKSSMKK